MRLRRIGAELKRAYRSHYASGQKSQRGQALIEALVAMGILSVVAICFLTGLTWTYHVARLNDDKTMAESLARSEMERIRYADFPITDNTTPKLGGRYVVTVDANYVTPVVVDTATPKYTRYDPATGATTIQLVTVTITKEDGDTLLVATTDKVFRSR